MQNNSKRQSDQAEDADLHSTRNRLALENEAPAYPKITRMRPRLEQCVPFPRVLQEQLSLLLYQEKQKIIRKRCVHIFFSDRIR